jgi:hypothetical protein
MLDSRVECSHCEELAESPSPTPGDALEGGSWRLGKLADQRARHSGWGHPGHRFFRRRDVPGKPAAGVLRGGRALHQVVWSSYPFAPSAAGGRTWGACSRRARLNSPRGRRVNRSEPRESGTPGRADPSKRGDPPRSEGPATCVSLLCGSVPAAPSDSGAPGPAGPEDPSER